MPHIFRQVSIMGISVSLWVMPPSRYTSYSRRSSCSRATPNYYRGPRPLAHFDLYRISTENDLCAAGFYDYLDQQW